VSTAAIVGILGFLGIANPGDLLRGHGLLWLRIGVALISACGLTLAAIAFHQKRRADALEAKLSALQEGLSELSEMITN
jgi:hypothetical protein